MQTVKNSLKYSVLFLAAVLLLTGMLVLSAMIPQSAIRENILESAEFLCEGELFGTVIPGVEGSRIDRYADSILLGIAFQYDSDHPVESVLLSSYYHADYQNENANLLDAVTNGYQVNQQYLRYWHGSNTIVRPLLCFFSIQQIYLLNGIVLAVLAIWLFAVLLQKKAYLPAIGILAGFVLTSSWFVPLSLEYTWTYLLMLIVSVAAVKLVTSGRQEYLGVLFLLSGIVTSYLDFLTTETLTVLIPLLLVMWIDFRENPDKSIAEVVKKTAYVIFLWGVGYVCMWAAKWILAAAILQENVMPYISGHVQERIGMNSSTGFLRYIIGAVLRNVKCLFPLEYGTIGIFAAIALLLVASYPGYVYHKSRICKNHILAYMAVGVIPYIRYMFLANHSYLHCFFTYRAQIATVAALVMILGELVDWRYCEKSVFSDWRLLWKKR